MSSFLKNLIWDQAEKIVSAPVEVPAIQDRTWLNYKTILFTAVVLFGTGYVLKGLSNTISSVDDAFDGE